MEPVISVKNIGKKYKIMHQLGGYISLRDVIMNVVKSPLLFLKRKTKKAMGLERDEIFWALKDVNFDVQKGEIIGIIGRNGAGKSTLLKILSQITPPTEGEISVNGKIGSLLEVGTGFHPELSGRENIFLNGAILGMSKREIAKKFDKIVEFSGVEKFLDTPVKHYSSGMYVRLAFSVAAHMEPDILIIDEVLAVGDSEFQKKCLGKMEEVTNNEGRTVLFVSHNMAAIKQICPKTILMEGGRVKMIGPTQKVIDAYLEKDRTTSDTDDLAERKDRRGTGKAIFTRCQILKHDPKTHELILELEYLNKTAKVIKNAKISVDIYNSNDIHLANITNNVLGQYIDLQSGHGTIKLHVKNFNLGSGRYHLEIFMASDDMNTEIFDWLDSAKFFDIDNDLFYPTKQLPPVKSQILFDYHYEQ